MPPLNAYRVHLIHSALGSLVSSVIWTGMILYQIQIVGLTPLQLVLIGTTMEVTIFLFEVPTGIVADVYSRRLSTIIGTLLMGGAYFIQGVIATFGGLVIGNIVWGIGYTFTSGAYQAWLVDEVGIDRAGNALVRGAQAARIAGVIGIGLSVLLGSIHLHIPILVGAALLMVNGLFLIAAMPETGFKPTPREDRGTFGKLIDTFRDGVRAIRGRPALLTILGVGLVFGLFSEGWDRLWQTHLITSFGLDGLLGLPAIAWFGGMELVMMLLTVIGMEIVRRRVKLAQSARLTGVLFGLTAVMVAAIIGYGLAPQVIIALGCWFAFGLARELIAPLLATWTNDHIDSGVRATVLSLQSQTDAIGQMVGGPPIGLVGQTSLRAAFVVSGAILAPALILLRRVRRQETAG